MTATEQQPLIMPNVNGSIEMRQSNSMLCLTRNTYDMLMIELLLGAHSTFRALAAVAATVSRDVNICQAGLASLEPRLSYWSI